MQITSGIIYPIEMRVGLPEQFIKMAKCLQLALVKCHIRMLTRSCLERTHRPNDRTEASGVQGSYMPATFNQKYSIVWHQTNLTNIHSINCHTYRVV